MKKALYLFLFSLFLIVAIPSQSKAEETVPPEEEEVVPETTEVITEERVPSVDENTLPNVSTIDFEVSTGGPTLPGETGGPPPITTHGLNFAKGTIGCYTMSKNAYCPWTIKVGGDTISYSNVRVYLEKHYGMYKGWKAYKTFKFDYQIYRPTSTIRNEASAQLTKGKYRATLGGSFLTVKNGRYDAIANGKSYFEVK